MTNNELLNPKSETEIDRLFVLRDLPRIIWRGKWFLVVSAVATLAIGAAYTSTTSPVYMVQARVLVQKEGLPLEKDSPARDDVKTFLATQSEIIRSPAVLRGALQSFQPLVQKSAEGEGPNPLALLQNSLGVSPVLSTNVLSITLRSPNSSEGAKVLDDLIVSYKEYVRQTKHDAHSDTMQSLTQHEQSVRAELKSIEQRYQQLRVESPLAGSGRDASSIQRDMLTQLGQKLTETKNRRIDLENQLQAWTASRGSSAHSLVTLKTTSDKPLETYLAQADATARSLTDDKTQPKPETASDGNRRFSPATQVTAGGRGYKLDESEKIQEELWRAQIRAGELSHRYGNRHSEVRAAQEQVLMWEKLLAERQNVIPAALQQELAALKLTEQNISTLYEEEFRKVKSLDVYQIKEQQTLSEIQRVQALHDSTLNKLQQWRLDDEALAKGRAGVIVQVLEEPGFTQRQIWPRPMLLLSVSTAVGLAVGLGLIVILDRMTPKHAIA